MIFFVGLIKISVNGKLIKEEKETFFENSFLLRPITLNGNNFSENKANLSHLCLSHLSRSKFKKNKKSQAFCQCRGLSKTHTKILRCVTTFLDGDFDFFKKN